MPALQFSPVLVAATRKCTQRSALQSHLGACWALVRLVKLRTHVLLLSLPSLFCDTLRRCSDQKEVCQHPNGAAATCLTTFHLDRGVPFAKAQRLLEEEVGMLCYLFWL